MLPSLRRWHSGFSFIVLGSALHGAETSQPWAAADLGVESGVLWQVGPSTPLAYRLVPTQLSWRSAEFLGHEFTDGSRLVVRHRFTLLGTWIQQGPEAHYVGVAGSPSVEWWNMAGTWSVFGGAGGGVGAIDSRGVKGGQGQDFTLTWFARGGIEYKLRANVRGTVGVMFQHLSNGGRTNPNPGIDAVGFTVGWVWHF